MANNRLFMLHRPTGVAAYLGKRMGFGWYNSEQASENIAALFEYVKESCLAAEQDDFVLIQEEEGGWQYGKQIGNLIEIKEIA